MTHPTLTLADANFVTASVVVGGDLSYDDELAVTQAMELITTGITHVLDVRLEWDDTELWSAFPEVTYRWDGIDDAGQRVPARWFDVATSWAQQAIEDGGIVFTHCHLGVNRGPSTAYAVLLRLGWDPIEALSAIQAARPIAGIAYVEDALAWHLERIDASPQKHAATVNGFAAWRAENPLHLDRILRSVDMRETS